MNPTTPIVPAPLPFDGYARVSTSEQDSIPAQVAKIRAYCELHGLPLRDVVIDHGVSAKSLDRPGIREVLDRIEGGLSAGVVIAKLDRLTRSLADWSTLIDRYFGPQSATCLGVGLMSVSDSIDTSKATGRLILNIIMTVAQWERETIAERTQEAMDFRKAKGRRTGSIPWGKRLDDDGTTLLDNPEERIWTEAMVALKSGDRSLREICEILDDLGVRPRDGGLWQPSSIRAILKRATPLAIEAKEAR